MHWDLPQDLPDGCHALAITPEERDAASISVEEFLRAQAEDAFCRFAAEAVGTPNSKFDIDRYGFLVRKSPLDGTLQRVVPTRLRPRVLYVAHHPRLAGHPGATHMYYTLGREYYWPHMASDAFSTLRNCTSCAATCRTLVKNQKDLKLIPAAGPLEFVAMDLLGPLPKAAHGNQHILVITDRFSKLTRSIPLRTTTASVVANAFLDNWVYVSGAPRYVLTDNGPQFAAKFFDAVCALLGLRHYLTTAYHPQSNGQTERFNRTLVQRLRHYVEGHQRDWDDYVQPLTFAYNTQVHGSTETTPFDLVLTRPPSGLILPGTVPQDAGTHREDLRTPLQYKRVTLRKLRDALDRAPTKLTASQKRFKDDFGKKVRSRPVVGAGDSVYVDRPPRPITSVERRTRAQGTTGTDELCVKLLPRTEGPFRVRSATDTTVLIEQDGVENRVGIDCITKMPRGRRDNVTPATRNESDEEASTPGAEYVVDFIVGHRTAPGRVEYKVRWYVYTAREDTYEPADGLPQPFIDRYWRTREGRTSTRA